jgi:hypothetical protein
MVAFTGYALLAVLMFPKKGKERLEMKDLGYRAGSGFLSWILDAPSAGVIR